MSTSKTPKPKLFIRANFLGPIMSIDQPLSSQNQNMIYASNGTGKSFLARAFRALDGEAIHESEQILAESIISEESKTGQADFSFAKGALECGSLKLCAKSSTVERKTTGMIFHVFSSDFVETELTRNRFEIDGQIEREIIVGKETVEILKAKNALKQKIKNQETLRQQLSKDLECQKDHLSKNYQVRKTLSEFKALTLEAAKTAIPSEAASYEYNQAKQSYNDFRAVPNDETPPSEFKRANPNYNFSKLEQPLAQNVNLLNINEKIREKINKNREMIEVGSKLQTSNNSHCPLCDQELSETANSLFIAYKEFFSDAESIFTSNLENAKSSVQQEKSTLEKMIMEFLETKIEFDQKKRNYPSTKELALVDISSKVEELIELSEECVELIRLKREDITSPVSFPNKIDHLSAISSINKSIEANNRSIGILKNAIENSDKERINIQRLLCQKSLNDFSLSHSSKILELNNITEEIKFLGLDLEKLKVTFGGKVSARARVASTFSLMLKYMFGDKYTFDSVEFVVSRNTKTMTRGGDRTLSDGEKTVLSFCYYVAQIHLKVSTISDYEKIFFVIDDPVSSLSNNYMFNIVSCLKSLRIDAGDVNIDGKSNNRPELLILTHNDYFFNLVHGNNVVKDNALFLLSNEIGCHTLKPQKGFVSPHTFHLMNVYLVSIGKLAPDFTTPNSIRSVIVGIWKFCRGDLSDLSVFIAEMASGEEILIKSALINQLSHGGNFSDQSFLEDQIKTAAADAVRIVDHHAKGQIDRIKKMIAAN